MPPPPPPAPARRQQKRRAAPRRAWRQEVLLAAVGGSMAPQTVVLTEAKVGHPLPDAHHATRRAMLLQTTTGALLAGTPVEQIVGLQAVQSVAKEMLLVVDGCHRVHPPGAVREVCNITASRGDGNGGGGANGLAGLS